jgi:hypothetical protein
MHLLVGTTVYKGERIVRRDQAVYALVNIELRCDVHQGVHRLIPPYNPLALVAGRTHEEVHAKITDGRTVFGGSMCTEILMDDVLKVKFLPERLNPWYYERRHGWQDCL